MGVGSKIHRHAVEIGGEVRAVVQIKAAQEILIGLAGATVLSGNHAGDYFYQFGNTTNRAG